MEPEIAEAEEVSEAAAGSVLDEREGEPAWASSGVRGSSLLGEATAMAARSAVPAAAAAAVVDGDQSRAARKAEVWN